MQVAAAAPVSNMPNTCGVVIRELLAVGATTELDKKGISQTNGLKNYEWVLLTPFRSSSKRAQKADRWKTGPGFEG